MTLHSDQQSPCSVEHPRQCWQQHTEKYVNWLKQQVDHRAVRTLLSGLKSIATCVQVLGKLFKEIKMMLTLFIDGLEILAVPAPWCGECDKNVFCFVQGNIIKVMDIKDQGFRGWWGLDVRFHTRLCSNAEKNTLARRGHTNMVNAQ
jgi:hypothetical protein